MQLITESNFLTIRMIVSTIEQRLQNVTVTFCGEGPNITICLEISYYRLQTLESSSVITNVLNIVFGQWANKSGSEWNKEERWTNKKYWSSYLLLLRIRLLEQLCVERAEGRVQVITLDTLTLDTFFSFSAFSAHLFILLRNISFLSL